VTINILNYSFLPNDRYHNVFHLREDHTLIPLIDDMEVHVMELPKLDAYEVPVGGGLVNWLLFLRGVDQTNWEALTVNEPMLKKAMNTLEFLSQDAQTRMEYDARLKFLRDEASRVEGAKAEGRAEGRAEGEQRKAVEIAKNLLAMGIDIKAIAKASGLSEAEVRSLQML
jgi:predicted transposase/invertase (TIGR01784 family)